MKVVLVPLVVVAIVGAGIAPGSAAAYVYHGRHYAYRYNGHYYKYRHRGHYYNCRYNGHYYNSRGCYWNRYHPTGRSW